MITALVGGSRPAGTKLFEDVGAVRGDGGFLDVVLLGDLLGGVSELASSVLGAGLIVDERGDGLAEGVRGVLGFLARARSRSRTALPMGPALLAGWLAAILASGWLQPGYLM